MKFTLDSFDGPEQLLTAAASADAAPRAAMRMGGMHAQRRRRPG